MTISTKIIASVALAIALPLPVPAQSDDAAYCKKLSATYKRYVGAESPHRGSAPDTASVDIAMSHCQSDAANSIPVIEKALKDAKVDLPPRT